MVELIGEIRSAAQVTAIFSVFLLLNIYVIMPALAVAPSAADAGRCDGLATIKSARDAVINTPQIDGAPGNLLSESGGFKDRPVDSPCDPDVTYGPFEIASGGKLNASILGTPPVPSKWSMGDWNAGLVIYYEPKYSSGYGPGKEILRLRDQHERNNLNGSAEWPGPGRMTVVITAPSGSGALSAGCFEQSYSASVDIVSLNRENPAKAGTAVQAGDRIHTGPSGSAVLDLTCNGASLGMGPKTDVLFTGYDAKIAGGTPQLESPAAKVQMKLDEFYNQGLPMPSGYYQDPNGFILDFREGTQIEAQSIINSASDPCEASVELKLFFESHQGEITAWKIGEMSITLVKTLTVSAFLGSTGLSTLTGLAAGVPINQALDSGWIKLAKDAYREYIDWIAANDVRVGLEAFRNSRGWTKEQTDARLSELRTEIEVNNSKIRDIKESADRDLDAEYQRLIQQYGNEFNIPKAALMQYHNSVDNRIEQASGQIAELMDNVAELSIQDAILEQYRKPIAMGTCDRDLKKPKVPVRQNCPESAATIELNEGTVRYSNDKPSDGKKSSPRIGLGAHIVAPEGTEMVCEKRGDSCKVTVIKGNVSITNATRPEIVIGAGQQIDLGSGTITSFNVSTDDGGLVDGIPLRDLPLDDASGLPYGLYMPNFSNDTIPVGWIWQDPGNDAKIETPENGTLKVTVPDGNEFWDARTQAPRLLHKVTGDFDLEGELLLKSNGTDQAVSEFLMYSPGSFLGYQAKQMNLDGLGAHYRVIGGGWLHMQGKNKLVLLNEKFADGPNAPDLPVRFRLTRHGDIWKSYWSPDGVRWNISTRQEIAAPDTVWVGWLFKRNAYDGLRSEPAITTLRDVRLETAPNGSMNDSDWDLVQGAGRVQADDDATVHMELDGSSLGALYASNGERLEGDFDAVVRYQAENWTRTPGEYRSFGLSADSLDIKTLAFIGIQEKDNVPERYMTDLGIDERFGRYQWKDTSDFGGYLRILRQKGNLSTYYWNECQWIRLDKFGAGFSDPVYIRMWISNRDEGKVNARLSVNFTVEQIITGEEVGRNWTPAYCSILLPASLPAGLKVPDGMEARMFQSPFALGTIFFGPDGEAYASSNQKGKQKLLDIDSNGTAKTYIESELLAGVNRKSGTLQGENVLVTVDYWPESGNRFSGIYELKTDGTYRKWNLTQDYGGLADIIRAPEGGLYFADFEKDNIWHLPAEGVAETTLITKGEVPPGLFDLAYDEADGVLYALNVAGGWPFGGKFAVYRITDEGEAALLATINETSNLNGEMALCSGGPFGRALYVTDTAGGSVLKVDFDGTVIPVVTGLVRPGCMEFNPLTGDLWVVCNDGRDLLIIGREGGVGSKSITGLLKGVDGLPVVADDVDNYLQDFSGRIYFPMGTSGQMILYSIKPDGTGLSTSMQEGMDIWSYDIRPYDHKVVFSGSAGDISLMNLDGSDVTQIKRPNEKWDQLFSPAPRFSPDGKQIVFAGQNPTGYRDIFVMDVDGKNEMQLTSMPSAWNAVEPVFSSDGKSIAFSKGYNADTIIMLMDSDGANQKAITGPNNFGYSERWPALSPDGNTLACYTTHWTGSATATDIATLNLDGLDFKRLTNAGNGETEVCPWWNPDGSKLVYVSVRNGLSNLYIIPADGGDAVQVTDNIDSSVGIGAPIWLPE